MCRTLDKTPTDHRGQHSEKQSTDLSDVWHFLPLPLCCVAATWVRGMRFQLTTEVDKVHLQTINIYNLY